MAPSDCEIWTKDRKVVVAVKVAGESLVRHLEDLKKKAFGMDPVIDRASHILTKLKGEVGKDYYFGSLHYSLIYYDEVAD